MLASPIPAHLQHAYTTHTILIRMTLNIFFKYLSNKENN
jgi:hypothetical protein